MKINGYDNNAIHSLIMHALTLRSASLFCIFSRAVAFHECLLNLVFQISLLQRKCSSLRFVLLPVMACTILIELSPECLWDKCLYRSTYSSCETRNFKALQIPRLKSEHVKKDFTTLPLSFGTMTQIMLRNPNAWVFQRRTKGVLDEVSMLRTNTLK